MNRDTEFETVCRQYPFAPLVELGVALGRLVARTFFGGRRAVEEGHAQLGRPDVGHAA